MLFKSISFVVFLAFDIVVNFLPYLIFFATALSQTNELIGRGIFLAIYKSDLLLTGILGDRPMGTKIL
jgi:hypothetical protein